MPDVNKVQHRGYFGIGIEHSKTKVNVGTLWRSAMCFDASFIFTIGQRYKTQSSDTLHTDKHIPYYAFTCLEDFQEHRPYNCPLIGVDIIENAEYLESFLHPTRAIYLLGPEDGTLSKDAQKLCQYIIKFESRFCTNVAVAGSIVMYDRHMKESHR